MLPKFLSQPDHTYNVSMMIVTVCTNDAYCAMKSSLGLHSSQFHTYRRYLLHVQYL